MHIQISDQISLTDFRPTDKSACVVHLNDREIYRRTLRIPYPYTQEAFDNWLNVVTRATERHGGPVHFAIRHADDHLIGGIGFDGLTKGHRGEVGYWLAQPFWGQGIMTAVVGKVCQYAFDRWTLVRITAHVFSFNEASARVLEKNGFEFEGLLRKQHLKDGQFVDSKLYALVR